MLCASSVLPAAADILLACLSAAMHNTCSMCCDQASPWNEGPALPETTQEYEAKTMPETEPKRLSIIPHYR